MQWNWREYQTETIDQVVQSGGVGLIALPLGAGKSAVAVEIVRRMGAERILIVAPLNTHGGWQRHFEMFMPHLPFRRVDRENGEETLARLKEGEPMIAVTGWEYGRGMRRTKKDEHGNPVLRHRPGKKPEPVMEVIRAELDWSKYPIDAAIVDESARMGNRKSQQTKVVHSSRKAPIKLALSATPAGNTVEGIWSTLHWLWPDRFRYFGPWAETFLEKERNRHADKVLPNGKRIPGFVFVGEKRPGIIARSIPTYIKRTEEEVHGELPEVVVHDVPVALTAMQRRIYTQFEEDALAWLDEHPVAAALPITKDIRLKETLLAVPTVGEEGEVTFKPGAKSSKLDAMMDILADMPEDEKVLVWTHSKKIIPAVLDRLAKAGIEAVTVNGGNTKKATEAALSTFKDEDGARVLVATIQALGEGVDGLQHVCATEVWLSQYTVVLNKQASGRLRRPGQTRTINRFVIRAEDTIETKQLGRLKTRQEGLENAGFM